MANKTWARLVDSTVAELLTIDAALVPGKDIPALWTDDVTNVSGIAVGWIKAANGTFSAPPVVVPTLAQVQASQIAVLKTACQNAITGGFQSSALGAPHTYPSAQTDQANMTASVVASIVPGLPTGWTTPFWCEDGSGNWAMVPHTAAQIQKAGQDGLAMVVAAQQKLTTLEAQVQAATTAAAVQAISWS